MGSQRKRLKMAKKNLYAAWGYSLWYVKTDPSQNQDSSTSIERPYEEALNAF